MGDQLFEYAVQTCPTANALKPTLMLNLANVCLDSDQDERAKDLIDQLLLLNNENQSAYKALACYWYKKHDLEKTLEALWKAAALGGWRIKASKKNRKISEDNEAKEGDDLYALERKSQQLKELIPLTTAELIQEKYPAEAEQIREQYQVLHMAERVQLPRLPMVRVNTLKDFLGSVPVLRTWGEAVGKHAKKASAEVLYLQTGIKASDSKAVKKQKGRKAAMEQLSKVFGDADKMLERLGSMPDMPKDNYDRAQRMMDQTMKKKIIKKQGETESRQSDEATDSSALDNPNNNAGDSRVVEVGTIPGMDSGSIFAKTNFMDYQRIKNCYQRYLSEYYKDYQNKSGAIVEAYTKLMAQEEDYHDTLMKQIDEEIKKAEVEAQLMGGDAHIPAELYIKHDMEKLRHKKLVNTYGNTYYMQWINLYMPQYTQKMKPQLEEFWNVSALYIRNMNSTEVMKQEYCWLQQTFWNYAALAASYSGGGKYFKYLGDTTQEEAELEQALRDAEEEAKRKEPEFERETKSVLDTLPKWLEDKLVLAAACEFLSIKITPRNIEFEAYLPGLNGKAVYDFEENTIKTYSSLCAKVDVGVRIGPLNLKAEGRLDILESESIIDVKNGKFSEGTTTFAKGDGTFTIGPDNAEAAVNANIVVDPALDNEVSGSMTNSAFGQSKEYKF